MKLKKTLKKWTIEEVNKKDVEEVFQLCKKYLKEEKIKKYELSSSHQFLNILLYSQRSWLIAELILSVLSFIFCSVMVQNLRLFFLSFVSILFAGLMVSNWLRNLFYDMWELENTCAFTTEKVLIYKMIFMSTINVIFLFLLSLYTSVETSFHFLTVLAYGCIPFFITVAIILELCIYWKSNLTLLIGFVIGNMISYVFCSYFFEHPSHICMVALLIVSFVYVLITSYRYLVCMEKKKGSLLWN